MKGDVKIKVHTYRNFIEIIMVINHNDLSGENEKFTGKGRFLKFDFVKKLKPKSFVTIRHKIKHEEVDRNQGNTFIVSNAYLSGQVTVCPKLYKVALPEEY